jgi:preprotein translocase subunit SecE
MDDEKKLDNIEVKPSSKSDVKKKSDDTSNKNSSTSFRDIKGEFGRIIWPSRKELTKKTMTVIGTSLIVGLIIVVMDVFYNYVFDLFVNLVK